MTQLLVQRLSLLLLISTPAWHAFTAPRAAFLAITSPLKQPSLNMSDQWDDEEEAAPEADLTTYDDAAQGLLQRKEAEDLLAQSDTIVPGSEADNQEKLRNAVRARTSNLGMDEASQEAIEAARARAQNKVGNPASSFGGLDLSQVTSGGEADGFDKLSINYDPEDDLSEEEMKAADALGFESFPDQLAFELKESTFPTLFATLTKVGILLLLAGMTGLLIVNTDKTVRDLYVNNGLLPSREAVERAQMSGMETAKELTASPKEVVSPSLLDL